ncbi:hypothetical protein BTH41_01571 [Bacillus mycoides]|nr:hypothetical protein BTH41_01571 [Bacillus mycoides]
MYITAKGKQNILVSFEVDKTGLLLSHLMECSLKKVLVLFYIHIYRNYRALVECNIKLNLTDKGPVIHLS